MKPYDGFNSPCFFHLSNMYQHQMMLFFCNDLVSRILPCNYQLSISIVHEIKFGDIDSCHVIINNLPYSDRYFDTDWQFEMLKRGKPMV